MKTIFTLSLTFLLISCFTLQSQTNLALQATASASASSSGSYGPDKWNDGNIGPSYNFGWLGTDPASFTTPAWMKFTWTNAQNLNKIRLYNPTHSQGSFVLFQGSAELQYLDNNNNWVTISNLYVPNASQTGAYYDLYFSQVSTTAIRLTNFTITGQHNPGWDEIELYNIVNNDDVGVSDILIPDTVAIASLEIDVKVKNFAKTNVDSFDVCYDINSQNIVCKTFYKSDFGVPVSQSFDSVNMILDTIQASIGDFQIRSWTNLHTDSNLINDTITKNVYGLINFGDTVDMALENLSVPDTVYLTVNGASVYVKNKGNYDKNSFIINASCANQIYTDTVFTPIAAGGSYLYNLPANVLNADLGFSEFKFFLSMKNGDIDLSNDTISKTIYGIVGLSESENNLQLNVYPNPAKDFIYIDGNLNDAIVEVYNTSGKIVKKYTSLKGVENKINISGLSKGVYLMKIKDENGIYLDKFIVK